MKISMIRASVETRNYEFVSYGNNESEALQLLKTSFTTFMKDNGGTIKWSEMEQDVYFQMITTGQTEIN